MHDLFGCRYRCSPHELPDVFTTRTYSANRSKKPRKIDMFSKYVEDVDILDAGSIRLDFERLYGNMLVIRCPCLLYGVLGQRQIVMGLGVSFDKALGVSASGG